MLKNIKAWNLPSEKHANFKAFMIKQVQTSLEHDCYLPEHPVKLSVKEWIAKKKKNINWDINYHSEEYKKECERVEGRNKWVNAICDSLEGME
jgi:hypothetical protein